MSKEKPLRKGLTVQEEQELVAHGQALKELRLTPGWPVLVDIIDRAVESEKTIDSLDLSVPATKVLFEIKVRKETEKRMRQIFRNVVELITNSDTLIRLRKMRSKPGYIMRVDNQKK